MLASSKSCTDSKMEDEVPGVCYFSSIPSGMTVAVFSEHMRDLGEINKVYLVPKDNKKKRVYTEGWVEFTSKKVAKRVASSLNANPVAANKRKPWYGELWNVRFLPDMSWKDLFAMEHEEEAEARSAHDRDVIYAKKLAKEFAEDLKVDKLVKKKALKAKDKKFEREPLFLKKRQKLPEAEIKARLARSHRTVAKGCDSVKSALNNRSFMSNLFSGGL